jgi:hypothetical protein
MSDVKPFGSIERAVKAFLLTYYQPLAALDPEDADLRVDGDLAFDPAATPWYIRVDKVPGSRATRFEGDFVIDVEVFGTNYIETESHALDIEALFLGYPHVVEVEGQKWVFDTVSQNTGPDDLPWESDEVSRLGATYVITARRR